ncbi:MAG: Rpn family recombination-promoting nuclease/putative transposase [Lachnospiraceae bacterium]|nr:Rpn family recombination-promoting nuclease/putative transposase [Lachnospiraceae bacterium]
MEHTLLPVRNDAIFKIFFADERNIEFLTDFLKSILTIPEDEYDEVIIVDPHLIRDNSTDKLGIVDVKIKTVSGKTVHIEIQCKPFLHMRQRLAYYSGKMITEQIGKSDKYSEIKQVISIIITEYEFIENSANFHHRFTMYDKNNKIELSDIVEINTLELCKIPDESDSRLFYWLKFIKSEGEVEMEALANKDPLMRKAVARLMELSADEKTRLLYEAREKERMDYEDRIDEARSEGEKKERTLWQGVVADKDKRLADKDKQLADKDKRLAELEALLSKSSGTTR